MNEALDIKIYDLLVKVIKDKDTAREISLAVKKTVDEAIAEIQEKAKQEKTVIKAGLKDELSKELVTKGEFFGEIKALRQELLGEIKLLRTLIYILAGLMIFLNRGTIEFVFKVFGWIK